MRMSLEALKRVSAEQVGMQVKHHMSTVVPVGHLLTVIPIVKIDKTGHIVGLGGHSTHRTLN